MQQHRHTKSCKKNRNANCRYNFPIPPMKTTKILEPLVFDNNNTKSNAKLIFAAINDNTYDENYTFDEFINELHMKNDEYIHDIQCSLN